MLFARSDSRIAVEVGDCPSSEDMSALRIDQGQQNFIRRIHKAQQPLVLAQNLLYATLGNFLQPQLNVEDRPFDTDRLDVERMVSNITVAAQLIGHSSLQCQSALRLHNLYSAASPAMVEQSLGIPAAQHKENPILSREDISVLRSAQSSMGPPSRRPRGRSPPPSSGSRGRSSNRRSRSRSHSKARRPSYSPAATARFSFTRRQEEKTRGVRFHRPTATHRPRAPPVEKRE